MPERKSAVSLDLDGVLFPRAPIQLEVFRPWNYNKPLELKHSPIYVADRVPQDYPLSFKEQAELWQHSKKFVKPKAAEIIKQIQADIKIGNTGRPNNLGMVNLTLERLRHGKIHDELKYVNFRPDGISSDESKYWGLKELIEMGYTDIIHFDDNARTIKRLALLLPEVQFVIVQDLTSGILFSRSEMKRHPNVTRIANLQIGKF